MDHVMMSNSNSSQARPTSIRGIFWPNAWLGTVLFCLGLWHWIACVRLYFTRLTYHTRSSGRQPSLSGRACLAVGLVKLTASLAGFAVEGVAVAVAQRDRAFTNHATYAGLSLSGIIAVLVRCGVALPPGVGAGADVVVLASLVLTMNARGQGHPHVASTCHMLQSYLAVGSAAGRVYELTAPASLVAGAVSSLLYTMQGIWLWQTGTILDSPIRRLRWIEASHRNVMHITIVFAWQLIGTLTLQLVVLFIARRGFMQRLNSYGESGDADSWPKTQPYHAYTKGDKEVHSSGSGVRYLALPSYDIADRALLEYTEQNTE